jgi:hypothetical protein
MTDSQADELPEQYEVDDLTSPQSIRLQEFEFAAGEIIRHDGLNAAHNAWLGVRKNAANTNRRIEEGRVSGSISFENTNLRRVRPPLSAPAKLAKELLAVTHEPEGQHLTTLFIPAHANFEEQMEPLLAESYDPRTDPFYEFMAKELKIDVNDLARKDTMLFLRGKLRQFCQIISDSEGYSATTVEALLHFISPYGYREQSDANAGALVTLVTQANASGEAGLNFEGEENYPPSVIIDDAIRVAYKKYINQLLIKSIQSEIIRNGDFFHDPAKASEEFLANLDELRQDLYDSQNQQPGDAETLTALHLGVKGNEATTAEFYINLCCGYPRTEIEQMLFEGVKKARVLPTVIVLGQSGSGKSSLVEWLYNTANSLSTQPQNVYKVIGDKPTNLIRDVIRLGLKWEDVIKLGLTKEYLEILGYYDEALGNMGLTPEILADPDATSAKMNELFSSELNLNLTPDIVIMEMSAHGAQDEISPGIKTALGGPEKFQKVTKGIPSNHSLSFTSFWSKTRSALPESTRGVFYPIKEHSDTWKRWGSRFVEDCAKLPIIHKHDLQIKFNQNQDANYLLNNLSQVLRMLPAGITEAINYSILSDTDFCPIVLPHDRDSVVPDNADPGFIQLQDSLIKSGLIEPKSRPMILSYKEQLCEELTRPHSRACSPGVKNLLVLAKQLIKTNPVGRRYANAIQGIALCMMSLEKSIKA